MTSRQLNSRPAPAGSFRTPASPVRRFAGRRLAEGAYGLFFSTVFLLCQSPAHGLAMGDIRVLSRLGQPLVAEIMVTPAAGEVLSQGCFSATSAAGDLPDVGSVRLTLSRSLNGSVLNITGLRPIREPMIEFLLQVKCPGVPTMVKSYLVMVDPPGVDTTAPLTETVTAPLAAPATAAPIAVNRVNRASRPAPRVAGNIEPGSRYTVQPGDMLSTIAARVAGRPDWSVWPIAQQIYRNNPGAFLLGNPNVIAEGSTIRIPRLQDIDMSARKPVAPLSGTAARAPAGATESVDAPAAVTEAPLPATTVTGEKGTAGQPAAAPVGPAAPAPARILPAPAIAPIAVQALPAMQLTTSLFDESKMKIELRAQGNPVAPAVSTATPDAVTEPERLPETRPEQPETAVTGTRTGVQPSSTAANEPGLNWLWVIVGLLVGLLAGAMAAVMFLRRNLRQEYEHDVREAVQRQIQFERARERDRRTDSEPAAAAGMAAAPTAVEEPPSMTLETPAAESPGAPDYTVEIGAMPDLDFEVEDEHAPETVAKTDPTTVEMPSFSEGLDLELPEVSGQTGQHEVDFDLLEQAYSEEYQEEFVARPEDQDDGSTADDDTGVTGEAERFYHLENRDPADDTPLPIELGEDEMGDDADDDSKIINFRRGGN